MAFAARDAFAAVGPDLLTRSEPARWHGLRVEKRDGGIRIPVGGNSATRHDGPVDARPGQA